MNKTQSDNVLIVIPEVHTAVLNPYQSFNFDNELHMQQFTINNRYDGNLPHFFGVTLDDMTLCACNQFLVKICLLVIVMTHDRK